MKHLILSLSITIAACSPESLLTPDECKVQSVTQERTIIADMSGDTSRIPDTYLVKMEDGRQIRLTEEQAIQAKMDPEAACKELMR